jgi:hypothetical protein
VYEVDQWLATREAETPANMIHDRYIRAKGETWSWP